LAIVTVIAEEHYGQGFLVAGDVPALGKGAVPGPGLVKFPAAHLAKSLLYPIQRTTTDNAKFLL
jgi:hypothetical protein